jgi:hypothetical protein
VAKDQQQVWDSVTGVITSMAMAASLNTQTGTGVSGPAPTDRGRSEMTARSLGTTSYAKAMQTDAVSAKVDQETAGLVQSREKAFALLREEHAVGVVVAGHVEVISADIFSDPELLARYWTKLVRSYAAEGLSGRAERDTATVADAQHFLDTPLYGTEDSQGEVGVYRYREVKGAGTDLFTLESLLPGTGYAVHVSRVKLTGTSRNLRPPPAY